MSRDTSQPAPQRQPRRATWAVPILAYHRVGEPRRDHVPNVTPDAFRRQLRWVNRLGFQIEDFGNLAARIGRGESISRRTVVVTFDDGYEETYSIVAPILRQLGCSATVFVTPKEVGQTGFLSWQQIRSIAKDGVTIGSHTMHHTYLPLVPIKQAEAELRDSKHCIEQELQQPTDWLSYPIGGYTSEIQEIAKAAGYRGACTTNRGLQRQGYDLFALRRIKMTERDRTPVSLWVKLTGHYDAFRRLERPS